MKSILGIICTFLLLFSLNNQVVAQDEEPKEDMLHVSLITPISTSGFQSWNRINHFSLNLISGFSGGLEGIEMAGFSNVLRWNMKGIQLAGFCNNAFGKARGIQAAGFYNYTHKSVLGGQFAGFANASMGRVYGIQGAGFSNHAMGGTMAQVSGFANTNLGDFKGLQAAGFANLSRGNGKGAQIAGFANVHSGTLKGFQAAGFVNYAKTIHGVQLGFINIADTLDHGIAIGFLSFVKNGYKVLQLGGNETLFGEVSFKTGVKRFYNIISIGGTLRNNTLKYGWGYGIGTSLPVFSRLDINIEAISYHLNEDWWWSNHVNLLNRVNLTADFRLTKKMSVYAGPSWNVWVTDTRGDGGMDPTFGDWAVYDRSDRHTRVMMYPGVNAGIRVAIN